MVGYLGISQKKGKHNMSGTKPATAAKRKRQPPPLSKQDALSVLRTALAECQRAGIIVALNPLSAGSLLLLRDIDLVNGVFVLRDTNATKARLPLLNSDSGKTEKE